MIEDLIINMKVIIVGNGQVGKTSMTQRFAKDIFTNEYKKTLGVDYLQKEKYIKSIDKEVQFMIWDTAGQEYYDAITSKYYKGADGAVIVFSVTDRDSFDKVKRWKEKIEDQCDNIAMILVMNKIDVTENVVVTEKEAQLLASELKLKLFKVSVKNSIMINEIFENLAVQFFSNGNIKLI